ncbi:MAG: PilN domain-containing protein [Deltaproteobacteria bacterium]|nr:PilN domain-containing protein [Deltaproteobacteria bacterium]
MIKINLLPFRTARKKENIRRQVSIFLGLVVLVLSALLFVWDSMSRKIGTLNTDIKTVKAELATYEETIRKVKEYKKKLKTVNTKKGVIKKLELERSGPIRIMDAMTQCVVRNRMWLKSMEDKEGFLNIKGVSVDNATIARFMKNLDKSKYFGNVDLTSSKQVKIDKKLKFKEFVVKCKTVNPDLVNVSIQSASKGVK